MTNYEDLPDFQERDGESTEPKTTKHSSKTLSHDTDSIDTALVSDDHDKTIKAETIKEPEAVTKQEIQPDTGKVEAMEPTENHPENPRNPASAVPLYTQSTESAADSDLKPAKPLTRFGLWLNELPAEKGGRYSIEAMLYWVSYGAGKVKPGLREQLENATELDEHGRIKKAVLSTRPEVLHDILLGLRSHFSSAQQLQILDLIFAVLVTGEGLKPVENLLLRFYCDYTGIGLDTLEARYRDGYAKDLPGIPRPDRLKWWDKQDLSVLANRQTSALSLFGLHESASDKQLHKAFKLAQHRHDPSRFSLLGEKEKSLAARNLEKYKHALETLVEIEV